MNRAIAAVYAISIRHPGEVDRLYTAAEMQKLIDCIPNLISEIERMEKLLADPFIGGYLEAKRQGCFQSNGSPRHE